MTQIKDPKKKREKLENPELKKKQMHPDKLMSNKTLTQT